MSLAHLWWIVPLVAIVSFVVGLFAESSSGHNREYKRKFKEASNQLDDMRMFAQKIMSENEQLKSNVKAETGQSKSNVVEI